MKYFLLIVVTLFGILNVKAQALEMTKSVKYAYVSVSGKAFTKKLKVSVDFGDSSEQQKEAQAYTDELNNITSYAAVLNYMDAKGFELLQTLESTSTFQGYGGTDGLLFLMRKRSQ